MGLTVVVLAFLILLTVMTGFIWWIELHACNKSGDQASQARDPDPIGLGIKMQPSQEGRRDIGYRGQLESLFSHLIKTAGSGNPVERWMTSAVLVLRAELGMDAEEGLLLPVQESEKIQEGKHSIIEKS